MCCNRPSTIYARSEFVSRPRCELRASSCVDSASTRVPVRHTGHAAALGQRGSRMFAAAWNSRQRMMREAKFCTYRYCFACCCFQIAHQLIRFISNHLPSLFSFIFPLTLLLIKTETHPGGYLAGMEAPLSLLSSYRHLPLNLLPVQDDASAEARRQLAAFAAKLLQPDFGNEFRRQILACIGLSIFCIILGCKSTALVTTKDAAIVICRRAVWSDRTVLYPSPSRYHSPPCAPRPGMGGQDVSSGQSVVQTGFLTISCLFEPGSVPPVGDVLSFQTPCSRSC